MSAPRYWFRKVSGTSGRYVATDWRGYTAIVACVIAPLVATYLAVAVRPWLALIVGPIALIGALWWLFAVVVNRAEP